jgi:hypothetical protein
MYTKTNMIKTLVTARKLLKSGFIQGDWICNDRCFLSDGRPSGKTPECCAEGSVQIAAGLYSKSGEPAANTKSRMYSRYLIGMLDEKVKENTSFDLIREVNDAAGSTYTDVAKYFNLVLKDLRSNG